MDKLRKSITDLYPLTEAEWDEFECLLVEKKANKHEMIVRSGEEVSSLFICKEGLFRLYYVDVDGKIHIKSFLGENQFFGEYQAALNDIDAKFSIEAMEKSVYFRIEVEKMIRLYESNLAWSIIGRKLIEGMYFRKLKREHDFLKCSPEERYMIFIDEYKNVSNRIPDHMVANYIGINPVSLSRIKRRMSNNY